jgi:hypothetical protein
MLRRAAANCDSRRQACSPIRTLAWCLGRRRLARRNFCAAGAKSGSNPPRARGDRSHTGRSFIDARGTRRRPRSALLRRCPPRGRKLRSSSSAALFLVYERGGVLMTGSCNLQGRGVRSAPNEPRRCGRGPGRRRRNLGLGCGRSQSWEAAHDRRSELHVASRAR